MNTAPFELTLPTPVEFPREDGTTVRAEVYACVEGADVLFLIDGQHVADWANDNGVLESIALDVCTEALDAHACQWCGETLAPEDGTQHEECEPVPHPYAEELLDGRRTPRSWRDAVIDGDEDLPAFIDAALADSLAYLMGAASFGAEVAA